MSAALKQRAYQYIRERLTSGVFREGMTLSPVALAKEIKISHTPVREAIAQLESQGLLEIRPRLGPVVRRLERHDFEEILDLRMVFELGATGLAASYAGSHELDRISNLCREYFQLAKEARKVYPAPAALELVDKLNALDAKFHDSILAAAKNRRLVRLAEDLRLSSRVFDYAPRDDIPGLHPMHRLVLIYRYHSHIARALQKRDKAAAQEAMRAHLQWSQEMQLRIFDWRRKQEFAGMAP